MRMLAWVHRWTGGLIGLLLALLGLTGTLLLWKETYLRLVLRGADADLIQDPDSYASATEAMVSAASNAPRSIIFSQDNFRFNSLSDTLGGGFYADQSGTFVAGWSSSWDRPETFLFDLHHHLLIGDSGEIISGVSGLVGIGFILTGFILWWKTRKKFKLRLLPQRLTRSAIIRHHRDLGVVIAPLLFLTMFTGVMLTLRPVATLVLSPLSSKDEMQAATAPPDIKGGAANDINWSKIYKTAALRFPEAELRITSMPKEAGDLITLRMKQPSEWLPNGRTLLWFDPATSKLIDARDANNHPIGLKTFNIAYPVHAAKIGGWTFKLLQTLTGLTLALLGTLAVWSFWFKGGNRAG